SSRVNQSERSNAARHSAFVKRFGGVAVPRPRINTGCLACEDGPEVSTQTAADRRADADALGVRTLSADCPRTRAALATFRQVLVGQGICARAGAAWRLRWWSRKRPP